MGGSPGFGAGHGDHEAVCNLLWTHAQQGVPHVGRSHRVVGDGDDRPRQRIDLPVHRHRAQPAPVRIEAPEKAIPATCDLG
jgi:hypothetical protein